MFVVLFTMTNQNEINTEIDPATGVPIEVELNDLIDMIDAMCSHRNNLTDELSDSTSSDINPDMIFPPLDASIQKHTKKVKHTPEFRTVINHKDKGKGLREYADADYGKGLF